MRYIIAAAAIVVTVILAAGIVGCGNDLAKADELLATGDFDGAAAVYQKRLDKNANDGAGTIGMANVRYLAALENAKSGKDTLEEWNKAIELLEKAILIDPAPEGVRPIGKDMLADALYRAGMKKFKAEDWAGTADALSKAIDNGIKTPELYVTLARAYAADKKFTDALKAAYTGAKKDPGNVDFLREAAGWASADSKQWMHHYFYLKAEQAKPIGFKFKKPAEITKGLEKKYGALNMINDTLGHFFFEEEVGPDAWSGILEREPLIEDMAKFIGKKPPSAFSKEDRGRLHWVVYHYWNSTGVVFAYLGDKARANKWLNKAAEIDAKKIKHSKLSPEQLENETTWCQANMNLLK